jgi:pyruvate ferredoxin oxidoreductase beta subunit
MKVAREHFKSPKDIPAEEFVTGGSSLCAGCGGLTTVRLVHKVLGGNVVLINAAGCMTLMATYPYTPLRSSWLYTTMGSAAAGAQGVRDALDLLIEKGRMPADEDLHVVVLAGDGSSYDMGLGPTSSAIHRDLDFWYLCYDNEAYGNTGFQMSASSPFGSSTSTSESEGEHPEATFQSKKNLFEIWQAHHPPYAATMSAHDPVDLAEKVERAKHVRGPKLLLALAVCPTGWGFDPRQGHNLATLAVETGVWPLKELRRTETGDVELRHTYVPSRFKPVEEYLRPQLRFRHLFEPEPQTAAIERIQRRVDRYWDHWRETEGAGVKAGRPASAQ